MSPEWIDVGYLLCAMCFVFALRLMNHPLSARKGDWVSMVGMVFALGATFLMFQNVASINMMLILGAVALGAIIGAGSGRKVAMTAMPQMVALLNGLGGGAVALVALYEFLEAGAAFADKPPVQSITTLLSVIIGSISFSGSMIAFAKLQELMTGRPISFPGMKAFNGLLVAGSLALVVLIFAVPATFATPMFFLLLMAVSLVLGITGTMGIGGADMPVIISLLNSFTGCAAGLAGFVLMNTALLIGGALVGASGLILTLEMCKGMNRSLANVMFAGVGSAVAGSGQSAFAGRQPKSYSPDDAAISLANASNVVIVPGYGMAVAQAQHQVKEMCSKLQARGIDVKYAVHPVAGRMPGHMNVLLAEADVPYDQLYELETINPLFSETDVVLVIGANDVVNPAARYDKSSPIFGMPILDVDKARLVLVSKRSMGAGFAGVDNELFVMDNTRMVFGNAKTTIQAISSALENY
ncbi:MAG: NAD(P)(+) transhydrogenase (Re/Si-specific) subunit beta [Armatimonadetes bacterium]|nr:NAD(P)(+) transhydrogenase (Re/Si-specific) subunit beta [Armatimonadota bacterium]